MKKLLMAVAALFAVVSMASAAMIQWGSSAQLNDKNGSVLDGGTAYLVYLGSNTSAIGIDGNWTFSNSDILGTAYVYSGKSGAPNYTSSSYAWGTFSPDTDVNANKAGNYAMIVFDDMNGSSSAIPTSGSYALLDIVNVNADDAKDGTVNVGMINADSVNVSTPVPVVPEPTTYALVGLAAAALALRKRFLKK